MGRKILTKRANKEDDEGDSDIWDVTSTYKNPEGSEAERLAVYNAIRGNTFTPPVYDIPADIIEDVDFDLVDIDVVPLGQSFDVVVNIQNKSSETRTISAVLTADSVFYNGVKKNFIKREQGTFTVKAGEREQLKTHVAPAEYMNKLTDHNLIKIYGIANVKETKQTWSEEDDFTLFKPQLNVQLVEEPRIGRDCRAEFR